GRPSLALVGHAFHLLRNVPPPVLLEFWAETPSIPVRKQSHRLRTHLRRNHSNHGVDWEQLCVTHKAVPQFFFELAEDTVRLRLLATSERDQTSWRGTGREGQSDKPRLSKGDKPEVLEDPRLDAAAHWLRRLDWFTPEAGLWLGDAHEH